jgi:asparagine synthase (glutamine-hydrolysing)
MCGICGVLGFGGRPVRAEEVREMCASMVHRGPDEDGLFTRPGLGLGMRRLSIIDLGGGSQPIRNEDGTVVVVMNGEIYNYRELRRELIDSGHTFSTASDTETIVHLYEDYGDGVVEKLRGMFAFALWDERRRRLLLARDRIGIKPLYYTTANGRLFFASELKALLASGEIPRALDYHAVAHLLTFLTTPVSESVLAGVRKLPPGHYLVASPEGRVDVRPYWDVVFEEDPSRTEAEWAEGLREEVDESVRLHLASDVPLGAFLSGGIDSSAVVAAMARTASGRVKTFSIGFPEESFSELQHARRVAEHLGTDHHELVVEPSSIEAVAEIAWHLDEPFGDSSAIPTYMVSKLAAQHVKVVLSGDGGDELFGGYDKYVVEARERRRERWPLGLRRLAGGVGGRLPEGATGREFLRHLALEGAERYVDAALIFKEEQKQRLFAGEALEALRRHDPEGEAASRLGSLKGHWLSRLQYLDHKEYLPRDILTKVDRMSMAHSLEARVPLLDHKVVEFAARIPPGLKYHDGITKYIFKRSLRGTLPDAIIDRPKRGFAVPLSRWFRGNLREFAADVLLSTRTRERGFFNTPYVRRLVEMHEGGRDLGLQLWTLISFELWCRLYLDGGSSRPLSSPLPEIAHAAS